MIYLQLTSYQFAQLSVQQLLLNDYKINNQYRREWKYIIARHGFKRPKYNTCFGIWINYKEKYFYTETLIYPSHYDNVFEDNKVDHVMILLNLTNPSLLSKEVT